MTNSIDAKNDAARSRAASNVPDLDSVVAALGELDDEATIERAGKVHAYIVASGLAVTGGSLLDMVDEARTQVDAIELDEEANQPMRCTLDEFLCGADGADPWCKQKFADYIGDIDLSYWAEAVEEVSGQPSYGLVASPDSALLLHRVDVAVPWKGAAVVGYYNTPGAVCIADAHQGRGLGAELILWTAINFSEGPPTEGLDEQMFSTAGYAAHISAWRLGVERGLILDAPGAEHCALVSIPADFFRDLVAVRNKLWSMSPEASRNEIMPVTAPHRFGEGAYGKAIFNVIARLYVEKDLRALAQASREGKKVPVLDEVARRRVAFTSGTAGVPASFFRELVAVSDLLGGRGSDRPGWVGWGNLGKPQFAQPLADLFSRIEREPIMVAAIKRLRLELVPSPMANSRETGAAPEA